MCYASLCLIDDCSNCVIDERGRSDRETKGNPPVFRGLILMDKRFSAGPWRIRLLIGID